MTEFFKCATNGASREDRIKLNDEIKDPETAGDSSKTGNVTRSGRCPYGDHHPKNERETND